MLRLSVRILLLPDGRLTACTLPRLRRLLTPLRTNHLRVRATPPLIRDAIVIMITPRSLYTRKAILRNRFLQQGRVLRITKVLQRKPLKRRLIIRAATLPYLLLRTGLRYLETRRLRGHILHLLRGHLLIDRIMGIIRILRQG